LTYLDSDLAININKLSVDELLLKLPNLGVSEGPSDKSLQGSNSVLEVGSLGGLSSLSDVSLTGSVRDQRASYESLLLAFSIKDSRSLTVRDFISNDVDTPVTGDTNFGGKVS